MLPTPNARDHKGAPSAAWSRQSSLPREVALLPTPTAAMSTGAWQEGRDGGPNLQTAINDMPLLPTPTAGCGTGGNLTRGGDRNGERLLPGVAQHLEAEPQQPPFGPYQRAVDRWEDILGRPAPPPTVPGEKGKPRLSPVLVEWLMGFPEGWVTGADLGIARTQQLKMLGNSVVQHQALLALHLITERET